MSCSQKSKLSTESDRGLVQKSSWSKMFPEKVETEAQSSLLMKKLISVAVSNISYSRQLFPEDSFAKKSLDKLPLKILKEQNTNKEAKQLANYLIAVFDAIDKRYLKEFILSIYEDPAFPLSVLEVYSFKLSYPSNGITCELELQGKEKNRSITMENIKESTQILLKRLLEMTQDLAPIPEQCCLSVRLTYYDEVTPSDYHPKGFISTEYEMPQPRNGAPSGQVGRITTQHHSLGIALMGEGDLGKEGQSEGLESVNRTMANQAGPSRGVSPACGIRGMSNRAEEEVPESQKKYERGNVEGFRQEQKEVNSGEETNTPMEGNGMGMASQAQVNMDVDQEIEELNYSQEGICRRIVEQAHTISAQDSTTNESNKKQVFRIFCICGNDQPDPLMLVCHFCSLAQHAACYRILEASKVPQEHCCLQCSWVEGEVSRMCTDPKLYKIADSPAAPFTCVYRRVLASLIFMDQVSVDFLRERLQLEQEPSQSIFVKLVADEVVTEVSGPDEGIFKVQSEALCRVLKKYLGVKKSVIEVMVKSANRNNNGENSSAKEEEVEEAESSKHNEVMKRKSFDVQGRENKKIKTSAPVSDLVV